MPGIDHTKAFGIYHWDTFELPGEDTMLVAECDTLDEAVTFVERHYKGQIREDGADRVDIVDSRGNIVKKFTVG